MGRPKLRVLVVEDDGAVRTALAVALRNEGYEVMARTDGCGLDDVVGTFRPDAVVLDVRLPVGPSGFEIGESLRRLTDAPLLFLTAADSLDERLRGFDAGADDYLAKPFMMPELLARIKALLRRSGRSSSNIRQVGDTVVDEERRTVTRSGVEVELTPTEFELLAALFRHPGQVLSKTQLLTLVWGFEGYDTNLVEVHLSALRQKLEAQGPRVVHTVRRVGYVARA